MGTNLNARLVAPREARSESTFSLIFRRGQRPSAADVVQLSQSYRGSGRREAGVPGFAVSYQPRPAADWLELLAGGLTFDLTGLAPGEAAAMPAPAHFYGFADGAPAGSAEAISLTPGEQLRGAEKLLPVLRIMAGLAAALAGLAEITAVVWHPARSAMAPGLFAAAIGNWLNGGPFPALGLTALYCDADNTVRSEGLAYFIGQELRIEPFIGKNTAYYAKIATRLVNQLVGTKPIQQPMDFMGPGGEHLSVEPSGNDGFLRVWRKS